MATVKELVDVLKQFAPDAEVVFWGGDGQFVQIKNVSRDLNGDVGINWQESYDK